MDFHFTALNDQTRPLWDEYVTSHPWAWPGQDSAIVDFELSRGARSLSMLALDESDKVAAVSPLFVSESKQARFIPVRSLNTGQSLRGAPLVRTDLSAKDQHKFWKAWHNHILSLAVDHKIDIINVGIPHLLGDHYNREILPYLPLRDFGYKSGGNLTLIKDLSTCEQDLMQTVDSACRTKIRRAQSAGVRCSRITDRQTWLGFHELNRETFEGEPFEAYSHRDMEIIWDGFVARGLAQVFAIELDTETIGTLVSCGNEHSQYLWIGFNRRPRPVPGSHNYLTFFVMEQLRKQGIRFIEIGSLEFDDDRQKRIARFKQSFGGTVHPSMEGRLVLSELKMQTAGWLQALSRRLRKHSTINS